VRHIHRVVAMSAPYLLVTSSPGPFIQHRVSPIVKHEAKLGWSEPVPLAAPTGRVARFASIATRGASTYVMGSNVPFPMAPLTGESLFVGWSLTGDAIAPPPGQFWFLEPRSIVDESGTLHMVWAEPSASKAQTETRHWFGMRYGSIWAASRNSTGVWTKPVRLDSGEVEWRKSFVDAPLVGPDGRIHAFVPSGGDDLLHIVRDKSGWRSTRIPNVPAGYVSATRVGQTIVLAIVGADPAPPAATKGGRLYQSDVNSVAVLRSSDAGDNWAKLDWISHSDANPAHNPKILSNGSATTLVWVQNLPGRRAVLRLVQSRDGGKSWSSPQDLLWPSGVISPQYALDQSGALHVVFEGYPGKTNPQHFSYATWTRQSSWSSPSVLFPHLRSTDGALQLLEDGRLVLVFLAQRAEEPGDTKPRTMMSVLQPQ
jgi:hypothetical protein